MPRRRDIQDSRQWTTSHLLLDPSEVRVEETFIVHRTTTRVFVTARPKLGAALGSPFPVRQIPSLVPPTRLAS